MRGQSAGEYVLIAVLVLVLVSTVMLGAFRQVEIDLAISSVRLACQDMTASNPALQCEAVGYETRGSDIYITPAVSTAYSEPACNTVPPSCKERLQALSLSKMRDVFHKGQALTPGNCFYASFSLYCISYA